jgi:hypothetical protein
LKVVDADAFSIEKVKDDLYRFYTSSNERSAEMYLSVSSKAVKP